MVRAGRSPALLLSAAVIGGVVASGMVVARVHRNAESFPRRLAEAVGPHRVTRARLTGGFTYVSCDTSAPNDSLVTGLICERARPDRWVEGRALAKLAGEMRASAAHASPSASDLRASGAWHVVWGDEDAAIEELRAAAALDPIDASVQNDLAVAYLAHAERTRDPRLILDALQAVDSAIALNARLPEARFNRALVLEQFSIRGRALQEWASYLELDRSSPWADEARSRLMELRRPSASWNSAERRLEIGISASDTGAIYEITRKFPVRVRAAAQAAITEWAHAYQANESRRDTLLRRSAVLARAVASITGDALPIDIVASMERATSESDIARLREVARGLIAYDRGHRFLADFNLDSASVWIGEASGALAAARSAAVYWVAYDSAEISYQRAGTLGYDTALHSIEGILTTAPPSYRVVRGLAARMRGLIHAIRADYDRAISAYQAAAIEGRGTGDPAVELRPRGVLAALYAELRGEDEAWRELFSTFRSLGARTEAPGEAQRLFVMATRLSSRRHPAAAVLFQEEAVRLARAVDSGATMTVSALAQQAELLARAGRPERALESLRQARAATDSIVSDSIRAIKVADVDLAEGAVLLPARPESASVALRRAVDRYRETQYLLEVNRAHLLLANAYAASGKIDSARHAFEAALSETERQRSGILSSDDRMRFLDQARPVVDQVLRFHLDRADTLRALEFFEQMRSRVLLERVDSRRRREEIQVGDIERLRERLPSTSVIVSYAVLDSELVAWTIDRKRVRMHRVALAAPLGPLVERFSRAIEGARTVGDPRTISADLYSVLIAPIAKDIEHATRLVLVPDKAMHFVPFAALFDSVAGRFLVEKFEIAVAPSVELFRQSAARYGAMGRKSARVLVVGNPTFDRERFPLPSLPGAEREAVRVAEDYVNAHLLVGAAATRGSFLREAARADIIHFAGHGVINGDSPLQSYLVLARDPNDPLLGALYARELFDASLSRTRLAILSGCHTASGQLSETEGASSLARALFAAGVPAVVASLWAVDDERTATFFASYHQTLSRGMDPVTALREIQRQWISQPDGAWGSLSTWAAFQLFGATSPDAGSLVQQ